MAFRTNKVPVLQEKSASGSVATFNTALAMPLASCNIAVNAWQEGSGDPNPIDNIRPIHGFSEVNVNANAVVHPIQLGQEVYGAEVDAINGVAHCTYRYIDFNNVEFITYSSGTLGIYYCSTGGGAVGYNGNNLCSCFKKSSANNVGGMDDLSYVVREGAIYLRNSEYVNDLSGFTDSVKNNSMIIELSTPITIPLTPTQIETLIGNNTIFADTGDVDLTFKDLDIAKRGNFREVFKLPS